MRGWATAPHPQSPPPHATTRRGFLGDRQLQPASDNDNATFFARPAWTPLGGLPVERLYVRPSGRGWAVDADGLEPVLFDRGAAAEAHARRLARALARLGRDASIRIHDASDRIAGSIDYFAIHDPSATDRLTRYPWTSG